MTTPSLKSTYRNSVRFIHFSQIEMTSVNQSEEAKLENEFEMMKNMSKERKFFENTRSDKIT